jgi:hypothetical protein
MFASEWTASDLRGEFSREIEHEVKWFRSSAGREPPRNIYKI